MNSTHEMSQTTKSEEQIRHKQTSRVADDDALGVFNEKKCSLINKARELSVLFNCEVGLIIFSHSGKLYQYGSTDMDPLLDKYTKYNKEHKLSNNELPKILHKGDVLDLESSDNNVTSTQRSNQLSPKNTSKTDGRDLQPLKQHQMIAKNNISTNHSFFTAMPVNTMYNNELGNVQMQYETSLRPSPVRSVNYDHNYPLMEYEIMARKNSSVNYWPICPKPNPANNVFNKSENLRLLRSGLKRPISSENQGNLQKKIFKKINRCQTTSPVSVPVYHLPGLDSRIVTPNVPSHNKDNDNYENSMSAPMLVLDSLEPLRHRPPRPDSRRMMFNCSNRQKNNNNIHTTYSIDTSMIGYHADSSYHGDITERRLTNAGSLSSNQGAYNSETHSSIFNQYQSSMLSKKIHNSGASHSISQSCLSSGTNGPSPKNVYDEYMINY